jgi:hypothetical protein
MAKQRKQQQGVSPKRGLSTDTSYLNTPPGALTFALNVVNESEVGDDGWRSNEQSNEPCFTLGEGFIPIGQIYIGKGETVIFSVSQDEELSEIGITNVDCQYTTIVRHYLGFRLNNQISGTYRLRRGCERTLYFATPTPMIFNIDKPEDFQSDGIWDIDKFKLFKIYEQIPFFDSVEIVESGAVVAGSYNASIQYLDSDLNPTEWITTCEPIKIYNDSSSQDYDKVRGSTSIIDGITNFGITNKSIKFNFSNFDPTYPLYRVAIIAANTGNGLVSDVSFSAPISTNLTSFTYSGIESLITIGTEEDVIAFNNIITEAEFVEQIENRLILSKTKGVQVNFCNLQSYASRIKAQLHKELIVLNQFEDGNPKKENVNFYGAGYMPGEIYSYGIVYIFADSSLTPVYHIPGKADGYVSEMSSDNKAEEAEYQDESCGQEYWGLDSEGQPLLGQKVRHHRFPTRTEANLPLYNQVDDVEPFFVNRLIVEVTGTISAGTEILYRVDYEINGPLQFSTSFLAADYDPLFGLQRVVASSVSPIINITLEESIDSGVIWTPILSGASGLSGLVYNYDALPQDASSGVDTFTSEIMGIKFEGIDIPSQDDTNGIPIVGYYIVRNERTEGQKTVLDTGIITPNLQKEDKFIAMGHIYPTLVDKVTIDKDTFGLVHPEHLFNGREYKNVTSIVQHGEYQRGAQSKSSVLTQDVGAGTSYDPEIHKKGSADYDGFSLHTLTRETATIYADTPETTIIGLLNLGEVFYLNTLNFQTVEDQLDFRQDIYNISGDNKMGVIKLDLDIPDPTLVYDTVPYVSLNRSLPNPYSTFRTTPYFKENRNPIYFDTTEPDPDLNGTNSVIRNGDSYITPMKFHSAVFYNYRLRDRPSKSGTWKIIIGALLVVAGALITIGTLGGGAALGIAVAGYGISTISSGIETNLVTKVYGEQYDAGLRDTITDDDTKEVFGEENVDDGSNPPDDEMQWLSDVATNFWFESGVNMALRNGASIAITDFLNAPTNLGPNGIFSGIAAADSPATPLDTYILEKLTTIDTDNGDGRLYKGYAGAELYLLNRDYIRTNKQKVYFHLGLEYDCCSDCLEDFPLRNYYSEQSFQEELVDNYRVFLPNNYRDIEGEKGVITDTFRIQNNLYIHTEGALWHLPQDIQERVTGDVVSFIGTGSFFSIPPRKITDADKESAGTTHNWARMKTPNGTFFISADEGKPFLFDGNQLNPIFAGNETWFKANLPVRADADYIAASGIPYINANNPSNPYGTGFVSAYDTDKERFILTKRDFVFSQRVIGTPDFNTCVYNGSFIIFDGFQATIDAQALLGWEYIGLEDCRMKFSREVEELGILTREIEYIEGVVVEEPIDFDLSWTMSYSLEDQEWISWHSYMPNFYFYRLQEFYSWQNGDNNIYKHNKPNSYQIFYGTRYPHIIEYVDNERPRDTKLWDFLQIQSHATEFSETYQEDVDRNITFNKIIAYTAKQTTGILNLVPKVDGELWLEEQVINDFYSVPIDRHERDWTLNDLRDIVIDYDIPIFRRDFVSLQPEYYTDKVLNEDAIDYTKDWYDLQSFRDKYLVVRLIFDNFDNIRLVTNFTEEMDIKSFR